MDGVKRMVQALSKLMVNKEEVSAQDLRKEALLESIREVKGQLESVYCIFNNTTDKELTESCIYEMNSLYAKYSYYINCAKNEGINDARIERISKAKDKFTY